MNIKQSDTDKGGIFYIETEGERLAEMRYSWSGGNMVIEHTEVSEKLKGQGVGKILVGAAVNFARGKKAQIKPVCSFAKKVMQKESQYADVLLKSSSSLNNAVSENVP